MTYPDSLVNSLIVHLSEGAIKRVVRDDGENGLWVSHPDHPNQMHKLPRSEFRDSWRVHKTEQQQTKQDLTYTFDNAYKESNVVLNLQDTTRVPKETREPMSELNPRAEATDREALKDAILGEDGNRKLNDVTSDGDPVGANEESLDAFDPLRSDNPDAAAEEVEAVAEDAEAKGEAREAGVEEAAEEGLVEEPAPRKRRSKKDE